MMRMMRSINVPAAVVGYSAVVSCRLLCTHMRRRMIEDNKQFSEYCNPELDAEDEPSAAGFLRSEIDWTSELEGHPFFEDNYHAQLDAEKAAFEASFARSERERRPDLDHRKNTSEFYQRVRMPDHDAEFRALYAELEVLQKLYHQNPLDVQILRKLSVTMGGLLCIPTNSAGREQVQEWIRESKSLLEKALDINKNDDNVKFELGVAHYNTLRFDRTLKWYSNSYVEHVLSAYRYFKEVEDKGPEVYTHPMLDVLRRYVWPYLSDLESISRNWKSSSSELYHDNTEQNKKEYGDPSNTPSAGVVIGSVYHARLRVSDAQRKLRHIRTKKELLAKKEADLEKFLRCNDASSGSEDNTDEEMDIFSSSVTSDTDEDNTDEVMDSFSSSVTSDIGESIVGQE